MRRKRFRQFPIVMAWTVPDIAFLFGDFYRARVSERRGTVRVSTRLVTYSPIVWPENARASWANVVPWHSPIHGLLRAALGGHW